MRFAVSAIFALATAALVAAQPTSSPPTLNPPRSAIVPTLAQEIAAAAAEPQSNAKRFAIGLPPLAPKGLHRHRRQRTSPHGGSPADTARRSTTSPSSDDDTKCNILVKRANGDSLGFIRPAWNDYGEYGTFQGDQAGSLEVRFPAGSTSEIDFLATNTPSPKFPYFGTSTSWFSDGDSIGPGNPTLGYLVGTEQTPQGSPAAEAGDSFSGSTTYDKNVQSAIWKYDPGTNAISAQWVNEDSSRPASKLFFSNDDDNILGITGDIDTVNQLYQLQCIEVTFTCVHPPA